MLFPIFFRILLQIYDANFFTKLPLDLPASVYTTVEEENDGTTSEQAFLLVEW